ncbi:MAG: FAD:protein FMN transferase [Peptococcaceae bacterium]
MKRKSIIFCMILILSCCAGCAAGAVQQTEQEPLAQCNFFAMNTYITMQANGPQGAAALEKAEAFVHQSESRFSVTDGKSEIYAANHSKGQPVLVSSDTAELLSFALSMAEETGGALDPTIYPVLTAWGFTTEERRVPSQAEIDALLPAVDYQQITISEGQLRVPQGAAIDLGAVAKGYIGDGVTALLKEHGVTSALLNLGGNVQVIGGKPDGTFWRVGVRDPFSEQNLGVLEVKNAAVVTSGGYQNYFIGEDGQVYRHILDPKTGRPAQNGLASVTVVASEGKRCDALSTALFVMGQEAALDYWRETGGFELILVTEDRHVYVTAGLENVFNLGDHAGDFVVEVVEA